jgi:Spy/CpxP family protein refolding chaperone
MFGHLALGIILGAMLGRAFAWRRRFGFGCGGGWRRHGFGHGCHGHGHGRARRLFWLFRELGLSGEQIGELKTVWLSARGAVAAMRASGFQSLHALYEAAQSEPLDRVRLEETARRHADDHGQAARHIADAVARAHEILTPEQRAKLRAHLGQMGWGPGGPGGSPGGPGFGAGPYRSATFV